MPPVFFTAGQIGDRLARRNPDRKPAYFSRQVRGWAQQKCFPAGEMLKLGAGTTAAVMYDEADLLAAVIFAALTALGLPESQLREATGCFHNFDRGRADKQREQEKPEAGFHAALDGIKAGEDDWILTLRLNASGEVKGGSWSSDRSATLHPDVAAGFGPITLQLNVSTLAAGLFD